MKIKRRHRSMADGTPSAPIMQMFITRPLRYANERVGVCPSVGRWCVVMQNSVQTRRTKPSVNRRRNAGRTNPIDKTRPGGWGWRMARGGGLRRWQRGIKPDRFHEWMTPQGVPIKKKDPPQKGINATAKIDSDTVRMKKIASIPSRNLANLSKTK